MAFAGKKGRRLGSSTNGEYSYNKAWKEYTVHK